MDQITPYLELALIVVVVGSAAVGAAIKIVLIEYTGVKEIWNQVLNSRRRNKPRSLENRNGDRNLYPISDISKETTGTTRK